MKLLKLVLVLACLLVSCNKEYKAAVGPTSSELSLEQQNLKLQGELDKIKAKDQADELLGQYTLNMMAFAEQSFSKDKHLSEARKQILARSIVKVSNDVFETVEQRHAFVAVLAIESGFQKFAQSPTGPKGLAQVSKKAFQEAMGLCGIGNFGESDVWNEDLNLYAGACYFRQQLETSGNDIFLAIVAYNQGPASDSVKKYAKSGNLDEIEPLRYLTKFNFLDRKVNDKKIPGNTVVKDIGSSIKK